MVKIPMIMNVDKPELGLKKNDYIDENHPITVEQRMYFYTFNEATYDLNAYEKYGIEYIPGTKYFNGVVVYKDNSVYICELPTEQLQSSDTWIYSEVEGETTEWRRILKGSL